MLHVSRALGRTLIVNALVVAGSYVLLIAIAQARTAFSLRWQPSAVVAAAAGVGLIIATVVNARYAALLLCAILAYAIPLTLIQAIDGPDVMQGRSPHFVALGAAVLGVTLGAWRASRRYD